MYSIHDCSGIRFVELKAVTACGVQEELEFPEITYEDGCGIGRLYSHTIYWQAELLKNKVFEYLNNPLYLMPHWVVFANPRVAPPGI